MDVSGSYLCSAGETFDSIALFLFDSEAYAAELLSVNPEYCLVSQFKGGEEIRIPDVELPEEDEIGYPIQAPWR